MRVLFALVAFVALAAAHHGGPHGIPDLFQGQRQYVYNYRSLVATGLPRQSQHYAGLEKYGVLTVQVHEQQGNTKVLGFRLGHVMSGSFDKEVEDIENRRIEGVSHATEDTIEKYGPVFVRYQDNVVQKLKAPQGMPEEIINIYRGIAAVFTVGKPEHEGGNHPFMYEGEGTQGGEQPIVYRRQEQGITGNFETIYEVLSGYQQYNYLNVTKTRNYLKHVGRDGRFFQNGHDERGCQNVCPTHKPEKVDPNMQPENFGWEKPVPEGCPVKFHPKQELVESFTTYNYNMTVEQGGQYGIIHEAHGLDKKILPLRRQQIKTVSVLKLTLVEQRPISQAWQEQEATKQYDDITYRFPEGHKFDIEYLGLYSKAGDGEMLQQQILPMITRLAEIIVSDNIELKGQTGDKIVQLTMGLGNLNKQGLMSLWGVLGKPVSGETGTELEKVKRKVLIDTIGLSGSNAGGEFLVELIQQGQLTDLETSHTLETLQKSLIRPTTKIMHLLLNVCTDAKFQEKRIIFSTACIAFGEVVRGNCDNHQTRHWQQEQQQEQKEHPGKYEGVQFCGEQEYKQFVGTVYGHLKSATGYAQQTVYIQTLGRLSHVDAIKALIPYVYGEKEVNGQHEKMSEGDQYENASEYKQFLRQVAIYALHFPAKEHGAAIQPIVQGIYFNGEEDYEIRIAALSVLLATQPTEATFGRIVIELGREEDYEVASYAYSALRSLANSTLPCMRQSARRVQNVLGGLPGYTFGGHRSKWGIYTQYFPLAHLGLKGHWEVTQSNVSYVPRFIYGGLTGNKGPFVSTLGEFGLLSKGFESLGKYIHHHGGMNKIVENVMQRIRRDARTHVGDETVQKMLEHLEQTMQFNTEVESEQFRAVAFGNVLGNELYVPIDKEYMTKVAKQAGEHLIKILREGGSDKTYRYVRVLMPRTYVQVTPGVNGLPVVLSNRHPIVVSVSLKDLQTRFGGEKGQLNMYPLVGAISGFIQPTIYHTSIHTALTINPTQQTRYAYGVRAIEQTYLTLPLDVAVQYTHQTRTVGLTIRPRFEKVFFHKARAMTFKTEALLIRGVDQPLLESYTTLKTQQKPFMYDRVFGEKLGMPLRIQGMSMNEEYAVNFLRTGMALDKDGMTALIKEIANEWFVPRTWAVRVEQKEHKPVEEIKMIFRLGNLLKDRVHFQQKGQMQERLSQEQLSKEQAYPEHMRMIAYDQEFEKITGRKPETEKLEQAFERIAKKTEKYWSQVDGELRQKLNKENVQVRSLEYVISAKGEKKQLAGITGHLIAGSTLTKQVKLGEFKLNVENRPMYFEVQAVSAFTKAPQPFETEVREQEQRGILGFTAELETRQTGKQQYSGKVEMIKSEEQKQMMKLPVQQKPWYYRQCEEDKKEHKSEMSTACEITRYHKSALNQLRLEIDLPEQIHERLLNISHKAREALKVQLYRNLRATYEPQHTNTQENKLQVVLVYSERYPEMRMANLTIRTPDHEELRFERIAIPKALRPNTMWSIKEQVKAFVKNNRPEPVCVYNGQHLRTFDNVTIGLKAMKEGEKYVIARDNDDNSKFTILGLKKQSGQKPETEIEVLLRDATLLKLTPPTQQGQYKVRVNQTELEVSSQKAHVRQYAGKGKHLITLHVEEHKEGEDTLVVKVRDQRMRIVYDGKNLKVEVAKRQLKGQLTGLCGDMNNQHIDEFTSPRGCNFEHEDDFVRSFGLTKEQGQQMQGDWVCPEGIYPRDASQGEISKKMQEQKMMYQHENQMFLKRQTLREEHNHLTEETKMIPLGGKICFSVEPVQTCKQGLRQVQSEMQSIAFTCLQSNNQRVIQLQREVQTHKVAHNLPIPAGRSGSGLVHHEIEVATRCSQ